MPASDDAAPVCVTGASGFLASHLIAQLLAAGHRVRGTMGAPEAADHARHLLDLPGAAERLELRRADLGRPRGIRAAVRGCEVVHHTASLHGFELAAPDADLAELAVRRTVEVLAACKRTPSVRRVVLASSMAAITDGPEDLVLTEASWNRRSSPTHHPYYYSKTEAERAAWRFVADEQPGFDLIAINPFLVVGPSLSPTLDPSNQIFVDLLSGAFPGILSLAWGFVDVRDVARAHVLAMDTAGAAGRYLCAHETHTMREVVETLRALGCAGHALPRRRLDSPLGDLLVRVGSYLQGRSAGRYLRSLIGRAPRFDNTRIRRELGLEFRPFADTLRDIVEDLARRGHVQAPGH